jgi:hypothetical protein
MILYQGIGKENRVAVAIEAPDMLSPDERNHKLSGFAYDGRIRIKSRKEKRAQYL